MKIQAVRLKTARRCVPKKFRRGAALCRRPKAPQGKRYGAANGTDAPESTKFQAGAHLLRNKYWWFRAPRQRSYRGELRGCAWQACFCLSRAAQSSSRCVRLRRQPLRRAWLRAVPLRPRNQANPRAGCIRCNPWRSRARAVLPRANAQAIPQPF